MELGVQPGVAGQAHTPIHFGKKKKICRRRHPLTLKLEPHGPHQVKILYPRLISINLVKKHYDSVEHARYHIFIYMNARQRCTGASMLTMKLCMHSF